MKGAWMADRPENVYSSQKRLAWIASYLKADGRVLELGCDTGVMITLLLSQAGYHIAGIDRDIPRIARGPELAGEMDLGPSIQQVQSSEELDETFDVMVASEVFEHFPDFA